MPRIEIVADEADRRAAGRDHDPLRIEGLKPGMHGRWVRTKGYDAAGHEERMRRAGYVPVERDAKNAKSGADERASFAQGAQLDSGIQRGDLRLYQIPKEQHERYRKAQQEETQRRTRSVNNRLRAAGGYDETE